MKVTIIGTGKMARALGTRLLAGGHELTLVGTDPSKAGKLAEELADDGPASAGESPEGDVVILAVPYLAAENVLHDHGGDLDGKVVVDITNPLTPSYDDMEDTPAGSGAQQLAEAAPGGTHVVKAFNTTFANTLVGGDVAGQPLDVFLAGDDEGAKATVTELVESGGMRAIDTGPLARARELEALAFLHISMQERLGTGFASSIKVLA